MQLLLFLLLALQPLSITSGSLLQDAEHQQIPACSETTSRLRVILTALVQRVEAKYDPSLDKRAIRLWVLNIQQSLQGVHLLPDANPRHRTAKLCLHRHCIEVIAQALETNLRTLPPFTPELVLKKCFMDSEPEDVMQTHTSQVQQVALLEQQVKNLGLSRLNKVARTLEQKFKQHKKIAALLAIGVGGVATRHWRSKPAEHRSTESTDGPIEQQRAGELSQILMSGVVGVMAPVLGQVLVAHGRDLVTQVWQQIVTTLDSGWNYLKGTNSVLDLAGYTTIDDTTLTLTSDEMVGIESQIEQIAPILECALDLEGFVGRGNQPQYGILLVGPSGCGKTQFARALAGTLRHILDAAGKTMQVSFKEISCIDLRYKQTLRSYIAEGRKQGGIVVYFIDEIHNLLLQTNKDTNALHEFLTQMSDLKNSSDPNSHVFIIGSTNHSELLSSALLVDGRFGQVIYFNYPNAAQRHQFFTTMLPKAGINPSEIDVPALVRQTAHQVSYGKLRAIINEARISAAAHNEVVEQKHLQLALDASVYRLTNTTTLEPQERRAVAIYQASKALAHQLLAPRIHLERVTISAINPEIREKNEFHSSQDKYDPNRSGFYKQQHGTCIWYNDQETLETVHFDDLEKLAKIALAGKIGQQIILGSESVTYHQEDQEDAFNYALKITLRGKYLQTLAAARQAEIRQHAEALVNTYEQTLKAMLQEYKAQLEVLVTALEQRISLTGRDVEAIIQADTPPAARG